MATLEEVGKALQAADAAGAADDARQLARMYQRMKGEADQRRLADPTSGMSGLEKFGAGYGAALPNLARGIGQLTGLQPQERIDESKKLDAPLMRTGAGIAGNIFGSAAAFAPTAFIPGANTYTGAGLIGAGVGAMQPVATGESRALNTGLGAASGIAGQAIGNTIGRAIKPVSSKLSAEQQALATAAGREGIPLTAGQATGSRPLQITESVFENLPFTSAPQLAKKETQQRAFTAAALSRGGMTGDVADAATMLAQKRTLGGTLGNIAQRNTLDFNKGLTSDLANIVGDAQQHLPPDMSKKVADTIDKVLQQVNSSGTMTGTNYQGWREPLRGLAANNETGRYFSQIRKVLDNAFSSQLAGQDAAAFAQNSRQYANLKTIIDAMGGAGQLPARGQIAPAQLSASLARSVGKENKTLGVGDLNELARIGQAFVRDTIPNSGTAQRQFYQSLFTSGGGAVAGAGTAYALGKDPLAGAGIGLGIGGGALLAPKAVQGLLNSGVGQKYLTQGLIALTPAEREAINALARTVLIGSSPALEASR